MTSILTAFFAGTMIVLLPLFLLRTLQAEDLQVRWRAWAWATLALLAWIAAGYLLFSSAFWPGMVGLGAGALILWRDNRKPRIISHQTE